MRPVAVTLAVLMFLVTFPPTSVAADECAPGNAGALSWCVPIEAYRPTSPPNVPSLPPSQLWGKYYLWIGPGHCTSPFSGDCRSVPAGEPRGVPTGAPPPAPSYVGAGLFGVLFQESNGLAGLQRTLSAAGGARPPDRMVLV